MLLNDLCFGEWLGYFGGLRLVGRNGKKVEIDPDRLMDFVCMLDTFECHCFENHERGESDPRRLGECKEESILIVLLDNSDMILLLIR
jgi:hypothetical protein